MSKREANREIRRARRLISAAKIHQAIPRLRHVVANAPAGAAANEARYVLGLALMRVEGYRDAIEVFSAYLERVPEGRRAANSRKYLAVLTAEYEQRFPREEVLDREIDVLRAGLERASGDGARMAELAEKLWRRGAYSQAGALYVELAALDEAFKDTPVFRRRVELHGEGGYTVLDPNEVQRRNVEARPLEIIHADSFQSGRDLFTHEPKYYVVAGQAVNRSDGPLRGVVVTVTLYGFGNRVFDTAAILLGRVNPGETRAFSASFRNFPDIRQVDRFEAVGSFQR